MTATPIPAGVLTVDDDPTGPHFSYPVRLGGLVLGVVSSWQRGRLLAGPARPDGVPDDCIPASFEAYWQRMEDGRWRLCAFGETWTRAAYSDERLREKGVPVPPHQPDPDPEALLVEKITADWAHPDPADSATDHVEHYRTCNCLADSAECCRASCSCHAAPAAAGERTGPLGLNEGDPLMWNDLPVTFIKDDHGSRLIECESEERVWVDPASTFVVEWDAQPGLHVEAASRPDPDTIPVNLPIDVATFYAADAFTGDYDLQDACAKALKEQAK